jgi:hypothetical protein
MTGSGIPRCTSCGVEIEFARVVSASTVMDEVSAVRGSRQLVVVDDREANRAPPDLGIVPCYLKHPNAFLC